MVDDGDGGTPSQRKRTSAKVATPSEKNNKKQKKKHAGTGTSDAGKAGTKKPAKSNKKAPGVSGEQKRPKSTPKKSKGARSTVVESAQKTQLEAWSKKAMETQSALPPGNEEKKERDARDLVATSCNVLQLLVSNSMWPFVTEVMPSDDERKIQFLRNQVNHNTISPSLSNEITNNFLNNPIRANLSDKVYESNMGQDMQCILTYNTSVSAYFAEKKLHFVNIFFLQNVNKISQHAIAICSYI